MLELLAGEDVFVLKNSTKYEMDVGRVSYY